MGPFPIELCKENGTVSLQPRGARDGTRTHDLLITNQLRYQLRHSSGYSVCFVRFCLLKSMVGERSKRFGLIFRVRIVRALRPSLFGTAAQNVFTKSLHMIIYYFAQDFKWFLQSNQIMRFGAYFSPPVIYVCPRATPPQPSCRDAIRRGQRANTSITAVGFSALTDTPSPACDTPASLAALPPSRPRDISRFSGHTEVCERYSPKNDCE